MTYAKNNTKHGYGLIHFDAEKEAKKLLDRAITNYYFLMNHYEIPETYLIRRFNEDLVHGITGESS